MNRTFPKKEEKELYIDTPDFSWALPDVSPSTATHSWRCVSQAFINSISLPTLVDYQHGFRHNRSCESQLVTTIEDITKHLDINEQVDMNVNETGL
jgi:hypothetical protein